MSLIDKIADSVVRTLKEASLEEVIAIKIGVPQSAVSTPRIKRGRPKKAIATAGASKRGRGRPPGSKNRPKASEEVSAEEPLISDSPMRLSGAAAQPTDDEV